MSSPLEPSSKWQPRPRIRPKRCQSTPILQEQYTRDDQRTIGGHNAGAHGPSLVKDSGLGSSTRSLNRLSSLPQQKSLPAPALAVNRIGVSNHNQNGSHNFDFPSAAFSASSADSAAPVASASVQTALFAPLSRWVQGIAIRHEYVLEMSKKSKRQSRAGVGGGGDIMDSLVSSIDEIESKQMRALFLANGHRRQRSETIGSVISVSPAPVIQTSKSSTRTPSGNNKLTRRSSTRQSSRDSNGRLNLRSSSSQEHWLPPIEQEEDVFSVPMGHRSYSPSAPNNSNSGRHPSIPTRSTSINHDVHPPHVSNRSNSLLHASAPLPVPTRSPRRSEHYSDIPSYIAKYIRERTDSKENLSLDVPMSPRQAHGHRSLPARSRNSTTVIPGNDQFPRLKLVTKRQSSQGFERDMSATRHYYSLPPPPSVPRRSASLRPSRSSVTSDGSNSFSKLNGSYVEEVLSNPKLTQRIRLTSGRILSFSEVFSFLNCWLTIGWR
jgi:hypothetical protein